jgi:hypothetical protein
MFVPKQMYLQVKDKQVYIGIILEENLQVVRSLRIYIAEEIIYRIQKNIFLYDPSDMSKKHFFIVIVIL